MRRPLRLLAALGIAATAVAVGSTGPPGPSAQAAAPRNTVPTVVARATLSADFIAPGPPSGALVTPANGRHGPFRGQVIPGFSGMVDNGDGTFWAMPDNGFGAKANSLDFLLRLYHVTPDWTSGAIGVGEFISLRDPDGQIPFPIVNGATPERLLTGGDFDIESIVRARDGSFWIGEEFGPFLLHVDATGKLLSAPVEFPDGKSPANPYLQPGEVPLIRSSRGFEAMAIARNGRTLYPIVEGSFVDDPVARRRFVYEFDVVTETYTGRTWEYETDTDDDVIGDAFTMPDGRLLVERDDFEGPRDQAALCRRPRDDRRRRLRHQGARRRLPAHRQPG
ncbi:MAG: esterase-like activity of phytase family protein [Ilumatobacteraceae bacterium]